MKVTTNIKSGNLIKTNFIKNTIKLDKTYNFSNKLETIIKFNLKDFFKLDNLFNK